MANPEHVDVVIAGKDATREFRDANKGVKLDLSGADLSGADLSGADLYEADLSLADLWEANLSGANLSEANLNHANLYQAKLIEADLTSAYLHKAYLTEANLTKASLFEADLTEADLTEANLTNANLILTNLSRARMMKTNLAGSHWQVTTVGNVDFRGAVGLSEVKHLGPSTLGTDTLIQNPDLPELFLRGCGLPDDWITYIPSLVGSPFEFYSCFISYSHEDKQFAQILHDRLQGKGIRCWLDSHNMVPGDDMYRVVDTSIRTWDKILLCCSKSSLESPWVEREITTAIDKEMELRKKTKEQRLKIIPLDLDGRLFKWDGCHAAELKRRLAADFKGWKKDADIFEAQFERVLMGLRTDRGQPPPPESKLEP